VVYVLGDERGDPGEAGASATGRPELSAENAKAAAAPPRLRDSETRACAALALGIHGGVRDQSRGEPGEGEPKGVVEPDNVSLARLGTKGEGGALLEVVGVGVGVVVVVGGGCGGVAEDIFCFAELVVVGK